MSSLDHLLSSDTCADKRYTCPSKGCKASFARPSKLEAHKRKHTGEKPFVCDEPGCSKAYTNHAHLKRHKCCVHENITQGSGSPIMCSEKGCGQVLSNRYALRKHHKLAHNNSDYAYTCAQCFQGFQKKRQLRRHLYVHTGEVPFAKEPQVKLIRSSVTSHLHQCRQHASTRGVFTAKCSRCNIAFTARHLYNKHMSNHKTYTCDCGETFHRWTLFCAHRRTSCTIKKIDHKCVICNKTFTTKTNLTQHSLVHLKESEKEIHRCPYIGCKRSYQYKKNLNHHIAAFHEKLKDAQIVCTVPGCGRVLKSKKNLKQHLLALHSNVPKEKKPRQPRKDKGKPKKCMASFMSGVKLPLREHLTIINDTNIKTEDVLENTPECKSAIDFNIVMIDKKPLDQNRTVTDQQSDDMFLSENIYNLSDDLSNKLERAVGQT